MIVVVHVLAVVKILFSTGTSVQQESCANCQPKRSSLSAQTHVLDPCFPAPCPCAHQYEGKTQSCMV